MTKPSIHIIGGASGIGRWLLEKAFPSIPRKFCYDTNEKALLTLPRSITRCLISQAKGYSAYETHFLPEDWILLAVPSPAFAQVVETVAPIAKTGSLFVAMTSVQGPSVSILRSGIPRECTFLGCHPLFGATVASPVGQVVALCGHDKGIKQHREFEQALMDCGLLPTFLPPDAHDRYMALVQALPHFCLLGFASALSNGGATPTQLLNLRTPNFQFLYAFASRVLKLSPSTTGQIQASADASKVRQGFLATLTALHEQLEAGLHDTMSCARVIGELREPLKGAEVDEGSEVAAVAVNALQGFEELLHQHRVAKSLFVFRHRNTGKLRICRILDVLQDEVFLEEATHLVKKNGRELFAVGLGEQARENYRKIGIAFPAPSQERIKKRYIKPLPSGELEAFYAKEMLHVSVDFNFRNPSGHHEEYFEQWLPRLVKGLRHCELLTCFRKRHQTEKVALRLVFDPNISQQMIISSVKSIVEEGQLSRAIDGAATSHTNLGPDWEI